MLVCTLIVFIFSALCAASKGPGVQGTVNALIAFRFFIGACLLIQGSRDYYGVHGSSRGVSRRRDMTSSRGIEALYPFSRFA